MTSTFYRGQWENTELCIANVSILCAFTTMQTLPFQTRPIVFNEMEPVLMALVCHVSYPATTSAPAAQGTAWKSKERESARTGTGRMPSEISKVQRGARGRHVCRCWTNWTSELSGPSLFVCVEHNQRSSTGHCVCVWPGKLWQPDALFHFRWRRIIIWSQSLCGRILKPWNYDGWDYTWGEKEYISLLA